MRCLCLLALFSYFHETSAFAQTKPTVRRCAPRRTRRTKTTCLYAKVIGDADEDRYREHILESVVQTQASIPVIRQWKPTRESLWLRYKGTVLQTTLVPSIASGLVSLLVLFLLKRTDILPGIGLPFKENVMVSLERLDNLWHMHLTVMSFFLAFFLNASKALYEAVLNAARSVQGRLNDMNLIAASSACRDKDGNMTPEAQDVVATLSRYISLFSIFFYSGHCRRYKTVLDDKGLIGLETRGLLTTEERTLLQGVPPKSRFHAVLNWMVSTFTRGCESKTPCFRMQSNCHFLFLTKATDLRGAAGTISDELDARCPLAYVHFIQLLVDTFLVITPFAAVADMGWLSPIGSFLLCLTFSGLLDLSKILYDPLDNDEFGAESDNIQTDVLIQEANGGSQRYLTTGVQLPHGARQAATQRDAGGGFGSS